MDEADTISQQVLALQDKFNVGSHQSRVEWMHRWSVRGEEPIGACRDAAHVILVGSVVEWLVRGKLGWVGI